MAAERACVGAYPLLNNVCFLLLALHRIPERQDWNTIFAFIRIWIIYNAILIYLQKRNRQLADSDLYLQKCVTCF